MIIMKIQFAAILRSRGSCSPKSRESYLLRREVFHTPGDAVSENREIPGCQGRGILAEVVKVLPGAVIAQISEQLAVHYVLQYEIMRLCNHAGSRIVTFMHIYGNDARASKREISIAGRRTSSASYSRFAPISSDR